VPPRNPEQLPRPGGIAKLDEHPGGHPGLATPRIERRAWYDSSRRIGLAGRHEGCRELSTGMEERAVELQRFVEERHRLRISTRILQQCCAAHRDHDRQLIQCICTRKLGSRVGPAALQQQVPAVEEMPFGLSAVEQREQVRMLEVPVTLISPGT
jgi:hypothetical protein